MQNQLEETVRDGEMAISEFSFEPGIHLMETEDRIGTLESVIRLAEDAMEKGRFLSTAIVSPLRKISDGYESHPTHYSLSFRGGVSDAPLNEWVIDWTGTQEQIVRMRMDLRLEKVALINGDAVSRLAWCAEETLSAMFERGICTLNIWDVGEDEGSFLPSVDGEAKRRCVCLIVIKGGCHKEHSDGEVLPNIDAIPVYERCLALIRTEGRVLHSMLQRLFGLSYSEADRLVARLEREGVVNDNVESDAPRVVNWGKLPKGPRLRLSAAGRNGVCH